MLHKSFKNGTRGSSRVSSNAMDYFLGKDRDRDGARIIRGSEEDTLSVCKYIEQDKGFKNIYQSGCLSFEESNLSEEHKHEIMDSFETCLFADMEKDRYNIIWIEHTDKNRLELNYMIPMMDLKTERTLEVYNHARDMDRVNTWHEVINHEYGLTSPDHPSKKRHFELSKNLSKDRELATKEISLSIQDKILNGEIKDRAGVVAELSKNFEVSRETKSTISIKTDEHGTLRLKGEIFKSEIDITKVSKEHDEMLSNSWSKEANEKDYKENKAKYEKQLKARKERLKQRNHYPKKEKENLAYQAKEKLNIVEVNSNLSKKFYPEFERNKNRAEINKCFDLIKYNKEIINDLSSSITAFNKSQYSQKKRIEWLQAKQDERAANLIEKQTRLEQIKLAEKAKDSRFLGLGRFLVSKSERTQLKNEKESLSISIEKDRQQQEKNQKNINKERHYSEMGFSKERVAEIMKIERQIDSLSYRLEKISKTEASLMFASQQKAFAEYDMKNANTQDNKRDQYYTTKKFKHFERQEARLTENLKNLKPILTLFEYRDAERALNNTIYKASAERESLNKGKIEMDTLKEQNKALYQEAKNLKQESISDKDNTLELIEKSKQEAERVKAHFDAKREKSNTENHRHEQIEPVTPSQEQKDESNKDIEINEVSGIIDIQEREAAKLEAQREYILKYGVGDKNEPIKQPESQKDTNTQTNAQEREENQPERVQKQNEHSTIFAPENKSELERYNALTNQRDEIRGKINENEFNRQSPEKQALIEKYNNYQQAAAKLDDYKARYQENETKLERAESQIKIEQTNFNDLKAKHNALGEKRDSLGMFKFAEKKELDRQLVNSEKDAKDALNKLEQAEKIKGELVAKKTELQKESNQHINSQKIVNDMKPNEIKEAQSIIKNNEQDDVLKEELKELDKQINAIENKYQINDRDTAKIDDMRESGELLKGKEPTRTIDNKEFDRAYIIRCEPDAQKFETEPTYKMAFYKENSNVMEFKNLTVNDVNKMGLNIEKMPFNGNEPLKLSASMMEQNKINSPMKSARDALDNHKQLMKTGTHSRESFNQLKVEQVKLERNVQDTYNNKVVDRERDAREARQAERNINHERDNGFSR